MNKRLAVPLLPIMIMALLLSACDVRSFISGLFGSEKKNVWEDPRGDAPDKRYMQSDGTYQQLPALDIIKVTAEGKEGEIHAAFKISETFDDFFSRVDRDGRVHNTSLAEIYIDTDNNKGTGGAPAASKGSERSFEGYDVYIIATPSLMYKSMSGTKGAVSGDTSLDTRANEITGYYATYFIRQVPPAAKGLEFDKQRWPGNKRNYSSASGDTLEIRVPYEWLGLKQGDVIRLCYKELGQGAGSSKSFSEDKQLKLQ